MAKASPISAAALGLDDRGGRGVLGLLLGAGALRLALAMAVWLAAGALAPGDALPYLAHKLHTIDAIHYDEQARTVLQFWDGRADHYYECFSFSVVVAAFYRLFIDHPLVVVIFNQVSYALAGLLAWGILGRLGRRDGVARALALAVALWPPTLAWSLTPLREGPVLALVLGLLWWLLFLMDARVRLVRRLMAGAALAAAMVALVFLRSYFWHLSLVLLILPPLAALLPGGEAPRPGAARRWLAAGLACLVLAGALAASAPLKDDNLVHFNPEKRTTDRVPAPPAVIAPAPGPGQSGPECAVVVTEPALAEPSFLDRMLRKLSDLRRTSARFGGDSLSPEAAQGEARVALEGKAGTLGEALALVWDVATAALRDLFLWPYPWQPWPQGGGWGVVQIALAGWAALWYLALPGLAAGAVIWLRRRPAAALSLLVWGLLVGGLAGATLLNRGSLFRLKDMALIPLMLLWHPWPYLILWRFITRKAAPAEPPEVPRI